MLRERMSRYLCSTAIVLAGCNGMQMEPDLSRYTEDARRVIFHARDAVDETGGAEIRPEHLVLGLLAGDVSASKALRGGAADVTRLRDSILEQLGKQPHPNRHDLPLAAETRRILREALVEAERHGGNVTSDDILVAVLVDDAPTGQLLRRNGLSADDVRGGPKNGTQ